MRVQGREANEQHVPAGQERWGWSPSPAFAAMWSAQAFAADLKIALIADKTGPLEAYAKQTSAGFAMGLDYATGGTDDGRRPQARS